MKYRLVCLRFVPDEKVVGDLGTARVTGGRVIHIFEDTWEITSEDSNGRCTWAVNAIVEYNQ